MTPKFVPVTDINNHRVYPGTSVKGVQPQHTDWGSLYKDQGVGDSLANTLRHWDGECVVDVPFLIIGGTQSIAAVLEHDRNIRLVSPCDGGVVSYITRDDKTFGKSYTSVLVIPAAYFTGRRSAPVVNLANLRLQVNLSKLDKTTPAESLNVSRANWNRFNWIFQNYLDI